MMQQCSLPSTMWRQMQDTLGEHQTETQLSAGSGQGWLPRHPSLISEDEQEFAKEWRKEVSQ